ncbi:hypothetical protein V6N12_016414 [Hibiscus sabdariffa]|uniref:RNase H type-1 domain-containing protein n=1 Tax=Hibiscus sabdariffa TaxID=183260 RepID=A0ABR2CFH7_9ROSI
MGSAGGVLQDHTRGFILAYHRKLGRTTILQAEFWGVFKGLKLAWFHSYERLIVHIDSSDVHQLLFILSPDNPFPLIRNITELFNETWFVEFSLILRKANVVVDHMTKIVSHQTSLLIVFETPPVSLIEILY